MNVGIDGLPFDELLPVGVSRSEAWHEERRTGITASEIAVVLGISPWVSPWALWMQKRAAIADQPDNDAMRFGRRFEQAIVDEFLDRHPETFGLWSVGLCASRARPWQLATPDGLLTEQVYNERGGFSQDVVAVVEAKTTDSWDDWGDDGTDEIPPYYRAQVLWQCDVVGVNTAFVPVVARGKQYREYVVGLDAAARNDIRLMRARAEIFIKQDDPPPLDGHASTTAGLKSMFGGDQLDDRGEVVIPKRVANRYAKARAALEVAEERKALVENEIRQRLGNARVAVTPGGEKVAGRSVYQRRSIDSKRLRRDRPDVWAEFVNETTVDSLKAGPAGKVK
jgi:putative phage-type endonuclease